MKPKINENWAQLDQNYQKKSGKIDLKWMWKCGKVTWEIRMRERRCFQRSGRVMKIDVCVYMQTEKIDIDTGMCKYICMDRVNI